MNAMTREEFLDDLCPRVRPIIVQVMECGCGSEALDLLYNRPRTWNEISDIAYYLRQPAEQVVQTLILLVGVGVIERRDVLGITFYRLTEDVTILQALDQYWTRRELWRTRWEETQVALKL